MSEVKQHCLLRGDHRQNVLINHVRGEAALPTEGRPSTECSNIVLTLTLITKIQYKILIKGRQTTNLYWISTLALPFIVWF